jgi:hypothetical protein
VTASPVPFNRLHNFAPIVINNGTGNLNFELCGNAYYNTINLNPSITYELYAQIFIADCEQFYNYTSPPPTGVVWTEVFGGGPDGTLVSGVGTVCFSFAGSFNITAARRYHAAVGLGIKTDYVAGDKDDYDLDFSYQLRVIQ